MVSGVGGDDHGGVCSNQVVGARDGQGGQDGQAEGAADLLGGIEQACRQAALSPGTPALAAAAIETNTAPRQRHDQEAGEQSRDVGGMQRHTGYVVDPGRRDQAACHHDRAGSDPCYQLGGDAACHGESGGDGEIGCAALSGE